MLYCCIQPNADANNVTDRADLCTPFPLWRLRIYRHKGLIWGYRCSNDANGRVCSLHATDITDPFSASRTLQVSRKQLSFVQRECTHLDHDNARKVTGLCSGARRIRSGCKYDSCEASHGATMAVVKVYIACRAGMYLATLIGGNATSLRAS